MPPKKGTSTTKAEKDKSPAKVTKKEVEVPVKIVPKSKSAPKQQTLDSNKLVDDNPAKKTKSKQFQAGSETVGKSCASRWKTGDGTTAKKLTISSWNVNGIRSVMTKKQLQNYLTSKKPDIICIGETKIDEKAYDNGPINIEGYDAYWNFCKTSSGYSGVAIFSKHLPISVVEDIPDKPEHSQEGRVLTLEFAKFYLTTAYIPNAGQKLDRLDYRTKEWDVAFEEYLETLRKKKPVVLCGDLNVCHQEIDIARPKGNEKTAGFTVQERDNFTKLLAKGWVDTFRHFYPKEVKYSWWSMRTGGRAKNIGWRLDYFVVPEQFKKSVKDSRINNDILGSDHCPIEIDLEL